MRELPTPPPGRPQPSGKRLLLWLVVALLLSLGISTYLQRPRGAELSYSGFREQVEQDNVKQVTVQGQTITGQLNKATDVSEGKTAFRTYLPSFDDPKLMALLEKHEVQVNTRPPRDGLSWGTLLLTLSPILLLVGLGILFFRSMASQGKQMFRVGGSKARLYERGKEQTSFDDVAGADAAKTELSELVEYLKSPDRFESLGATAPRGVLLVGPPGTGKTLLARAVAGEANVPFFSITGSDFMEMFVGVGASRVRNMFKEAKKVAPSIIFIDELDSIGRRRGAGLGGGHDEREQTLNQLLSELDGFEPNQSVIVLAASNRPDILDPALLRPGRFDRQVTVDLPTLEGRKKILEIHARNKPLGQDVDLRQVARGTPGFSGADLENLLNEAAILATRDEREQITAADLEQARDKVLMGLEREGMSITPEECRILAYHEAGHAVVAAELEHADPLHKVSIVPRGRAMGVTQQLPEEERYLRQRDWLHDKLAVMLGGRAAERLALQTCTSGAEDDLKQATRLARKMVLDWGMSDALGPVAFGGEQDNVFLGEELSRRRDYSEATAHQIDEQVEQILTRAQQRAEEVLEHRRDGLERVAADLLEEEELPGSRVRQLLEQAGEVRDGGNGRGREQSSPAQDSPSVELQ